MKPIKRVMLVSILVAAPAFLTSAGAAAVSTFPSRPTASNACYILDSGVWTANAIRERELVRPDSFGAGWIDVRDYNSAKTLLEDAKSWIVGAVGVFIITNQPSNYLNGLPEHLTNCIVSQSTTNLVAMTLAPSTYFENSPRSWVDHASGDHGWGAILDMFTHLSRNAYPGYWQGLFRERSFSEQYGITPEQEADESLFVARMNEVWNLNAPNFYTDLDDEWDALGQSAGWAARVDEEYMGGRIDIENQVWAWESYKPAIVLYHTNVVTLSARLVVGYCNTPVEVVCDPPQTNGLICTGIIGALTTENPGCVTNAIPRYSGFPTSFACKVQSYRGYDQYGHIDAVSFDLETTPVQPPYSAQQFYGLCNYDDLLSEFNPETFGASMEEISIIVIDWNYEWH
jgi:hypothetical protein